MPSNFVPLEPAQPGNALQVVALGRKSKPNLLNENESIAASQATCEDFVKRHHTGPTNIIRLGEQCSGMIVDRESIRRTEDLAATGMVDLVITEDVGRLFRNVRHIMAFVQDCYDARVRFIAVADNVDTADENWEMALHVACLRHGFAVPDARRRVKRSADYAFAGGGMVMKIKAGYRKLTREEARTGQYGPVGQRLAKLSEWTSWIRLLKEWVCSVAPLYSWNDIAHLANKHGIPVGPYAKNKKWTGPLIEALMCAPILGGYRTFGLTTSRQLFSDGTRKTERNLAGPRREYVPELAHLSPDEFRELREALDRRYVPMGNAGKEHPLYNRPRRHSHCPAKHATCCACNDTLYSYDSKYVKCSNSGKNAVDRCWNHVQVNSRIACRELIRWLLATLDGFPRFRERVLAVCWREYEEHLHRRQANGESTESVVKELESQAKRLATAIASGVDLEEVLAKSKDVKAALAKARAKHERQQKAVSKGKSYLDRTSMEADLEEALIHLAEHSFPFASLLRVVIPRFEIVPVRSLDCKVVRPRAYVTLAVDMTGEPDAPVDPIVRVDGVLDLFEKPQHIDHLAACVQAKAKNPGFSLKTIGFELRIGHMTVKRALDLAKLMDEACVSEPYKELREPPSDASRWRHAS